MAVKQFESLVICMLRDLGYDKNTTEFSVYQKIHVYLFYDIRKIDMVVIIVGDVWFITMTPQWAQWRVKSPA